MRTKSLLELYRLVGYIKGREDMVSTLSIGDLSTNQLNDKVNQALKRISDSLEEIIHAEANGVIKGMEKDE